MNVQDSDVPAWSKNYLPNLWGGLNLSDRVDYISKVARGILQEVNVVEPTCPTVDELIEFAASLYGEDHKREVAKLLRDAVIWVNASEHIVNFGNEG